MTIDNGQKTKDYYQSKIMTRAIERIEKDIIALKEATRAIAQQLNLAYARYINTLGLALQNN